MVWGAVKGIVMIGFSSWVRSAFHLRWQHNCGGTWLNRRGDAVLGAIQIVSTSVRNIETSTKEKTKQNHLNPPHLQTSLQMKDAWKAMIGEQDSSWYGDVVGVVV
jgi:hypothetical protein